LSFLAIKNLSVSFGDFKAVDGVNLGIDAGEVAAVVGESGSGKSVAMLAVMGLLPWTAKVTADTMQFDGADLLGLSPGARRRIVGKDMAMIFQEPMTSLNPCFTVGFQIKEALKTHLGLSAKDRQIRAVELLDQVGIPEPEQRLKAFPHQLSGGMIQRVMIAMAISCNPRVLVADEPTTALDVTIQAQILDLLLDLQKQKGMAMVLITHDMGVVAETAETVNVQYAGEQVETGAVDDIFSRPRHPYTAALLDALPERRQGRRLNAIPGVVPGPYDQLHGCQFQPRCRYAQDRCQHERPTFEGGVRCFFPRENAS